ncbi:MAG TPA: hypothetical protein PKG80_09410, partial [Acidobacteriota bacterium]|nr:hypothetical protein [Acidobacteriota bacterium]
MKGRWIILASTLSLAGCVATVDYRDRGGEPAPLPPPPPPPEATISISADVEPFYDALRPYGRWVVLERETVWVPRVEAGWRPYSTGHWIMTEYGWTWVADEDWGWAPFHYGRWHYAPSYGWVWHPARVWGPAWVAWRNGGGQVGWAALPPDVDFDGRNGFRFRGRPGDFDSAIRPEHWNFVEERYMAEPRLRGRIAPPARNVTVINVTRNVTNYTVVENRIVNNSIEVNRIERAAGRPAPRARIVDEGRPGAPRGGRADEVHFYRPGYGGPGRAADTRPTPQQEQRQAQDERQRAQDEQRRAQDEQRRAQGERQRAQDEQRRAQD